MERLIENLRILNSKERFFLVGQALGNPTFLLGSEFRKSVSERIGVEIPQDAFVAMDFHLDWIYAGLVLSGETKMGSRFRNTEGLVAGQQEDIDLVIAFQSADAVQLVLIEAKGVTPWSGKQAGSKVKRLTAIFGEQGDKWPKVVPHFLLMSPSPPKDEFASGWPQWMRRDGKLTHIELLVPEGLQAVSRCDDEGKKSKSGECWQLRPRVGS